MCQTLFSSLCSAGAPPVVFYVLAQQSLSEEPEQSPLWMFAASICSGLRLVRSTVGVCMSAHVASSQVVRFVHVTLCVFLACDVTSSPLLCFVLLSDATFFLKLG